MIQCFVKKEFGSSFVPGTQPKLLSASKIDSVFSVHPRILHKHPDFLEIMYVRTGTGVYIVDECRYDIKGGDIIICNAGCLHDEDPAYSRDLNMVSVAVGDVFVRGLDPNSLIAPNYSPVFPTGECADMLCSLLTMIHSLLATDPDNAIETCHHLTMALLSKLLLVTRRYCEKTGNTIQTSPDIIACKVRQYIDTHFDERFTLQDISEAIRISPYHLAHIFKEQTGYSPMQYTLRRRLGEAQSLLIATDMTITEISVAVGFGNPSHFNTMFSKYIGMPPSKYRASYVRNGEDGSGDAEEPV